MKVIGKTGEQYSRDYICIVSHSEIEQYLNLYYANEKDKIKELKAGDTIELSRGYDFANKIADSMKQTRDFVRSHQNVISAIMQGVSIEALVRAAEISAPETEKKDV